MFDFGGQTYRTIIECKYWDSRVKKAQVATLMGVIADIGAEKGIIVSKKGFQMGARKLAAYTNISLVTYDELLRDSAIFVNRFKLMDAQKRIKKMKAPLKRFQNLMRDEAYKMGEFWYPSFEGGNLQGGLLMLEDKIESVDTLTYPRAFIFSTIREPEKEIWKKANNPKEYTDFILENIAILEYEFKLCRDKIFSE
jgi:hypothetical protein